MAVGTPARSSAVVSVPAVQHRRQRARRAAAPSQARPELVATVRWLGSRRACCLVLAVAIGVRRSPSGPRSRVIAPARRRLAVSGARDRRSLGRCPSRYASPPPADGTTRARLGPHGHAARRRRDAACSCPSARTPRSRRSTPTTCVEVGAQIILRQHLPPDLRPGSRAHRPARRPAPVHGLGPADPDRLGRLPGGQPGRPARDRRRRRHVPLAPRRLAPTLHARALDRRPGGAGLGHRGLPRPARPAARLVAGGGGRGDRAHAPLGRALPGGAPPRPDQALFGIIQGGLEPDLRAESTRAIAAPAVRRPVHRRPGRGRDAPSSARGARRGRAAARGSTRGRAT